MIHVLISKGVKGQSNIDVIADKNVNGEERLVVVLQRLKTSRISGMFIGVLSIGIKSNKRSFAIDQSTSKNYESKL